MHSRIVTIAAVVLGVGLTAPSAARAQSTSGFDVDCKIDCTITGVALAGILAVSFIPVDTDKTWDSELLGSLDLRVRDNFSTTAAHLSDSLIAATIAAPVLLQLDRGLDEDAARRALLYSESIAVSLAFNGLTKYLVQRPRPYAYNTDPRVVEYAREAGKDSRLSFFSGHSSTAFTAAVAGSYLFAAGSDDDTTTALVWLVEISLAAATANLRVRAGKHYYSDVILGAVVGGAIGFLVPALHADEGGVQAPSGLEWGAIAGGLVLGTVASQLIPLDNDITVPLEDRAETAGRVQLAPVAMQRGVGLGFSGSF